MAYTSVPSTGSGKYVKETYSIFIPCLALSSRSALSCDKPPQRVLHFCSRRNLTTCAERMGLLERPIRLDSSIAQLQHRNASNRGQQRLARPACSSPLSPQPFARAKPLPQLLLLHEPMIR